ncbi:MAG: hypothetical protein HY040_02305 [Planctomycetes bacterium]|nr:hypothetical protein [Planctomycetota bacterium]
MKIPIKFPNEADKIFEEASAYQKLPSDERFRTLFEHIAAGMRLMEHSPNREESVRLQAAQERQWQEIQKELFRRHGRGSTGTP